MANESEDERKLLDLRAALVRLRNLPVRAKAFSLIGEAPVRLRHFQQPVAENTFAILCFTEVLFGLCGNSGALCITSASYSRWERETRLSHRRLNGYAM